MYLGSSKTIALGIKKMKSKTSSHGVPVEGLEDLIKGIVTRVKGIYKLELQDYTYMAEQEKNGGSRVCIRVPMLFRRSDGIRTYVTGIELVIIADQAKLQSKLSTYLDDH